MNEHPTDYTRELCDFLSKTRFDTLPVATVERMKDLVLDHFGVALHSLQLPWTRIVHAYVQRAGGRPESTVYGLPGMVARGGAALANGTAAHGAGLDDTHDASMTHPGAVVVPAALALSESLGKGPRELLAAMVVGYEAMTRAGEAAHTAMSRGFHPTAISGVFGSTAAAAHLMRLDGSGFQSIFGLAEAAASGVMQFSEDGQGGMTKRIYAGMPAQSGLMMAELAEFGLRGPMGALDGRFGFGPVFGGSTNHRALTEGLGMAWAVDRISIKLYACCKFFHAALDALRQCRAEMWFSPDDVDSITVFTTTPGKTSHMNYRPDTLAAAQYSWPYALAATLLLDPEDPRSFSEESIANPALAGLMDRVRVEVDPELERYVPQKMPGGVRVVLKSGESIAHTRLDSTGTLAFPVDRDGIVSKFTALTSGVLPPSTQRELIDKVYALDRSDSLHGLLTLLSGPW